METPPQARSVPSGCTPRLLAEADPAISTTGAQFLGEKVGTSGYHHTYLLYEIFPVHIFINYFILKSNQNKQNCQFLPCPSLPAPDFGAYLRFVRKILESNASVSFWLLTSSSFLCTQSFSDG
jgi:hypothetical protein